MSWLAHQKTKIAPQPIARGHHAFIILIVVNAVDKGKKFSHDFV